MGEKGQIEIYNNSLTPNERRDNARKAGIASGKARKEHKALKELASIILNAEIRDEEYIQEQIEKYPLLEREQITYGYQFLTNITDIIRDKDARPSDRIKAFTVIADISGQKPKSEAISIFDENNELIIDLGEYDEDEWTN